MKKTLLLLVSGFLFIACSSNGRYALSDDVAPEDPIALGHIEDAVPKYEPFSRGGNKNYTLRGKHYKIIKNPKGFTQTGEASWYGKKFHGHYTSNGEVYDMYSMSAAHKTLPIPSYVKVTNTNNNKTVIVRVNDRGPFHDGRIIDLSYAAAQKLGVYQTGTAPVKIEYISVPKPSESDTVKASNSSTANKTGSYYIQVAAITDKNKAQQLAKQLGQRYSSQYRIESGQKINRIILGPWSSKTQVESTLAQLQKSAYPSAFIRIK